MWQPGEPIVRREIWRGKPYGAWGGHVVSDEDDLLALYMPEGSLLEFDHDFFGAPHPWGRQRRWHGHGVLHLQRPGEMHSVWVFWEGPARDFAAWYVNVQEPFRRTAIGIDTQDLELDVVIEPGGSVDGQGRRPTRAVDRARPLHGGRGRGDPRGGRPRRRRPRGRPPLVERRVGRVGAGSVVAGPRPPRDLGRCGVAAR